MPDRALAHLQALGAGTFAHAHGSLLAHLRATAALLRSFGSRDALCRAGLYHAVYGTDGIRGSLVGLDARGTIAAIIGSEAERLAYLYGACDRGRFHPRIGTASQLQFADRFALREYPISESDLRDFCELTLANELELARADDTFRREYGTELAAFFARLRGLVSAAAYAASCRTLGS